jgi:hypothetical protein
MRYDWDMHVSIRRGGADGIFCIDSQILRFIDRSALSRKA